MSNLPPGCSAMNKTRVKIFSTFAFMDGTPKKDCTWEGEVDIERGTGELDRIYRHFNRVDEADGERLEGMGYRLPSLSVADLIGILIEGTETSAYEIFQVTSLGFKRFYPGLGEIGADF